LVLPTRTSCAGVFTKRRLRFTATFSCRSTTAAMIAQPNAVRKHLEATRCKAHAHGTRRRRDHALTQHGLRDKNLRDTAARIRGRTREQALQETEHNRGRRSKARRRRHRCDACPEQRAVNKGQEDAACSVTKTRPRKTAKKERHKNKKNDPRSRSRKKGEISGKKPSARCSFPSTDGP